MGSNNKVDIEGNVTLQSIFAGGGSLMGITIFKDVDGGTVQLFDTNDAPIFPAAITDYGGSFVFFESRVWNGCKITTTGFTGGRLTLFYSKDRA